jgi:hypothetical protein
VFIIHSSSHTCGRCYFSNRFCPFQPIRFKHSPLFQALYRIKHHSHPAAVLPCGGCSLRVRARAKKSPSRSVPLEGAARLVETPVGESERRQSKLVLSAALSFTCGVALARQSSNVQASLAGKSKRSRDPRVESPKTKTNWPGTRARV